MRSTSEGRSESRQCNSTGVRVWTHVEVYYSTMQAIASFILSICQNLKRQNSGGLDSGQHHGIVNGIRIQD